MKPTSKLPIILLVFSNETKVKSSGSTSQRYLTALSAEQRAIEQAIEQANEKLEEPFCRLVILEGRKANIQEIYDSFNLYRGQIVAFHFAGHADGYQLLLQSAEEEKTEVAYGGGLVSFFRQQTSLKLIFLNGCETHQQAKELYDLGIPAVIGTNTAIGDALAKDFAHRFYRSLAQGVSLEHAWNDALTLIQSKSTIKETYRNRGIGATSVQLEQDQSWDLYTQSFDWNLGSEAKNPLFGLPPPPQLPLTKLPPDPFRYLERYGKDDAEIFFGRGREIRQLFSLLTSQKDASLILFYGQSGVGKSSVLEAGLLPRLVGRSPYNGNRIATGRRHPKRGLMYTLKEALVKALLPFTDQAVAEVRQYEPLRLIKANLEGVQEIESEPHIKDNPFYQVPKLVILLDQVEEAFTRPLKETGMSIQQEWTSLFEFLKQILLNPIYRYDVKVILSFRKEYHPEIQAYCKRSGLSWEDVFLRPLDEQGIREVVMGLQSTERLRGKYQVDIEETDADGSSLPASIAEDLMEDKYSPISPILQIQLSEMWEKEKLKTKGRAFTYSGYKELKRDGDGKLEQFFEQQMRKLEKQPDQLKQYIDAGLVLDLLHLHTTDLGTADQCRLEDLYSNYLDERQEGRQAINKKDLQALVNELIDLRLLLRLDDQSTRLAHDTLAPFVRKTFAYSELPGQRAAHILRNKTQFVHNADQDEAATLLPKALPLVLSEPQSSSSLFTTVLKKMEKLAAAKADDSNPLVLDPANLRIIEAGKKGMRKWNDKEQKLVDFNQAIQKKQVRKKQTNRMVILGLFLVMGGLAFWGLRNSMSIGNQNRLIHAYKFHDQAIQELTEGSTDSSLFFTSQAFLYNFPHEASHILKGMIVNPEEAVQMPGALIAIDTIKPPLKGVTLSPNGRYALKTEAGHAQLFPLQNREDQWRDISPRQDSSVVVAKFSQVGDRLCLLSNLKSGRGVSQIFDLNSQGMPVLIAQDTFSRELRSMDFYNDQQQILLGTTDSVMIIWNYQEKKTPGDLILPGAAGIESVLIGQNGQMIVSEADMPDGTSRFIWHLQDGDWGFERIYKTILDFSPKGKLALESFTEFAYLHDFSVKPAGQKKRTITLPGEYIWNTRFNREGQILVQTDMVWVFDQDGTPKDIFHFAERVEHFAMGSRRGELYFLTSNGTILLAPEGKSPMRWIEEQSFTLEESRAKQLPPTLSLSKALPTFYTKMIAYTSWLEWLILLALLNLLAHFYFSYTELKLLIIRVFGFLRPGLRITLVTAFLYCVLIYLFRFKISDDNLGMLVFFVGLAFVFNLLQLFLSYRSERYLIFYIWLGLVLIWVVALGRFAFNIDSYGIFEYAFDDALIDWPLSTLRTLLGTILLVHVIAFFHKLLFGVNYENWLEKVIS